MYDRLLKFWDALRTSFWFIPSLMVLASIVLAQVCLALEDASFMKNVPQLYWMYTGGAEGARGVLQVIAGSMITVAGVVFSITIVVLSLASSQLGPRLIRNFVHDAANQFVLGTFTATFVFCILILREVSSLPGEIFVPHLSISVGFILALVSIGVLIYFIHHIAISIQIPNVVAAVGRELDLAIGRNFVQVSEPVTGYDALLAQAALPQGFPDSGLPVVSQGQGFVTLVEDSFLVQTCTSRNCQIQLLKKPGDYAIPGGTIARVWGVDEVDDDLEREINSGLTLENTRSPVEDLEFAFNNLVEIAIRALSPGINDPFTAVNCINRIGVGLSRIAREEKFYSPYVYDDKGVLRLICKRFSFSEIVDSTLAPIRNYGSSSILVTRRLLEVTGELAPVSSTEQRKILLSHARSILDAFLVEQKETSTRKAMQEHFKRVQTALEA
ncbi:MAG: DUF2254 domain-containing protein [Desulfovibrionales bacterium]